MSNPNPSPDTRFGAPNGNKPVPMGKNGANVQEATSKGGMMRGPLRRIAGLDLSDIEKLTRKDLLERLHPPPWTLAEIAGVEKVLRSLQNDRAYDTLCDAVDGKLIEKTMSAEVSLEQLINESMNAPSSSQDS